MAVAQLNGENVSISQIKQDGTMQTPTIAGEIAFLQNTPSIPNPQIISSKIKLIRR